MTNTTKGIVVQFLAAFLGILAPSCSSDSAVSCAYGGNTYNSGDSFPALDGCNTCSCTASGQVACTLIGCAADGGLASDAPADSPRDGRSAEAAEATNDVLGDAASDRVATDSGDGQCRIADTYRFGPDGGLVAYSDESTLSPPEHYEHVRTYYLDDGPSTRQCAPALPPCGSNDVISILDVVRDLDNADVRNALAQATPPLFGRDTRPVDGQVYSVQRADGHGVFVGLPCAGAPSCVEIPAGLQALVDRLRQLDQQMLARPECGALQQP